MSQSRAQVVRSPDLVPDIVLGFFTAGGALDEELAVVDMEVRKSYSILGDIVQDGLILEFELT